MKDKRRVAAIIRWIARIWGGISLLFLIFMVGGHVIEALSGTAEGPGFTSTRELVTFLFFPVSTLIGLGLAWKWEGLGGCITLLGIAGLYVLRPDLILEPMFNGLAAPGVLFVAYWLLAKDPGKIKTPHNPA